MGTPYQKSFVSHQGTESWTIRTCIINYPTSLPCTESMVDSLFATVGSGGFEQNRGNLHKASPPIINHH